MRDAGDHAQSGGAKLFADGKRHRDIVARMSHLSGTDVGIVQVQRANQNSIEQHRLRQIDALRGTDHRAVRVATELGKNARRARDCGLLGGGQSAADGVEDQRLGMLDDLQGNRRSSNAEHVAGDLLDEGSWQISAGHRSRPSFTPSQPAPQHAFSGRRAAHFPFKTDTKSLRAVV
jgi:hypothetical protein